MINIDMNYLKTAILIFGVLVLSRLLPLPANSEPLLGLAVLTPLLTKNNFAFLLPLAVMFVSDAIIGFHNSMIATYTAIALAPFISEFFKDRMYTSLFASWFVWHIFANTGQWFPPFSLVSGLTVVVAYDIAQRLNRAEVIKIDFKKKHVKKT
jgi:hypothetical protein